MKITGGRVVDGRFERIEPRCHVCRDDELRVRVNGLLGWVGVPVPAGSGRTVIVGYTDVLQEVNDGRDEVDLITIDSLKIHARRHYEIGAVVDHFVAEMDKGLQRALNKLRTPKPIENR
jgi:hypothetical protein